MRASERYQQTEYDGQSSHRGPGRRPTRAAAMADQNEAESTVDRNQLTYTSPTAPYGSQSKFPSTIDIKFDKNSTEAQIKEHAMATY